MQSRWARWTSAGAVLGTSLGLGLRLLVAQTPAPAVRGDVNGDGQVGAVDALAVLSAVVGKSLPEGFRALPNGDADGNGRLTAADALVILAHAVGKDVGQYPVGRPIGTLLLAPDSLELQVGEERSLGVQVSGLEDTAVLWSSSSPEAVAVSETGTLVALRATSGAWVVATARADATARDSVRVSVHEAASSTPPPAPAPGEIRRIAVVGDVAALEIGDTRDLVIRAYDAQDREVPAPAPTWSVADGAVASVSGAGRLTALAYGSTTVTARAAGFEAQSAAMVFKAVAAVPAAGGMVDSRGDTIRLAVPAGAVSTRTTITVAPAMSPLASPTLVPELAMEFGPDGSTFAQPLTLSMRFDPAQLPAGVVPGDLRIYKQMPGYWEELETTSVDVVGFTVSGLLHGFSSYAALGRPPVTSVSITPGTLTLATGGTRQLAATLTEASPNTRSRHPVAWASLDTAVAQVSTTGLVTARQSGTVGIVASSGSKADTLLVEVPAASAGSPATLSVLTAPAASARSGVALTRQPVLQLVDAQGNPVRQAGVAVSVEIASGGGALTGATVDSTDADGQAAFADLALAGTVGSRTLRFSAPGTTPVLSGSISLLAGDPATLAVHQGDVQSADTSTPVAIAPAVVVRDASGNPVAGVQVTFQVATGAGTLSDSVRTTDADGVARLGSWTLGPAAGEQTLSVSAPGGLTPATIRATATTMAVTPPPPVATTLATQSGDGASPVVGTAHRLVARVTDALGTPVQGTTVSWSVASGGGTLSQGTSVSDVLGLAEISWTLGTTAGAQQATASVSGLSGSPVSFTVTSVAAAPTRYEVMTAATDSLAAGDSTRVTARLRDPYGNAAALAGRVVTWSSTNGGSFASATSATDSTGAATVMFTASATPGTTHEVTATDGSGTTGSSAGLLTSGSSTQGPTDGIQCSLTVISGGMTCHSDLSSSPLSAGGGTTPLTPRAVARPGAR